MYIYDVLNYIYLAIWDTQVGTTDDASGKRLVAVSEEGGSHSCNEVTTQKTDDFCYSVRQIQTDLLLTKFFSFLC